MKYWKLIFLALLALGSAAIAQQRDPLTDAEADQLRDVTLEPQKRIHLLIQFAEARLLAIDQMRADPKMAEGRGKKIHDLLQDFTTLMDETDDNLDMYASRPLDKDSRKQFNKGLQEMVEANERFDLKLRALKAAMASDPQTAKEGADFQFALEDAQEALQSSADATREYLAEADRPTPGAPEKNEEKKNSSKKK